MGGRLRILTESGELRVQRGDEEVTASVGDFVFLSREMPHTFLVTSPDAHFYELLTPGGMEQFHVDASDPAPTATLPPAAPPDVGRLVAALAPYDSEIVGPPMTR